MTHGEFLKVFYKNCEKQKDIIINKENVKLHFFGVDISQIDNNLICIVFASKEHFYYLPFKIAENGVETLPHIRATKNTKI